MALSVQDDIKLSDYSTFRVGGKAKFFVEVGSKEDLMEALEYAQKNNLKFFILGGGSNLIFSDEGYEGLIIRLVSQTIERSVEKSDGTPEFWAGLSLGAVVNFCRKEGWSGIEDLSGIPGTLGGAVRGNAGAYDMNEVGIASRIEEVEVLDIAKENLELRRMKKEDCQFDYRESLFKHSPNLIIVSVRLKLEPKGPEEIEIRMKEIAEKRTAEKPKDWIGSAGSFFKNPTVTDMKLVKKFEDDTGRKAKNGNIIPAFWLIREAGLAGKQIGGVQVSDKNSNFVVNVGGGTAEDAVILSSLIKQQVRDKLGVELKEEVQFIGF